MKRTLMGFVFLSVATVASAAPICGHVSNLNFLAGNVLLGQFPPYYRSYLTLAFTEQGTTLYNVLETSQQKEILTTALASGLKVCLDKDNSPQPGEIPIPLYLISSASK